MKTQFRLFVFAAATALALNARAQVTYQNSDTSAGTVSLSLLGGAGTGVGSASSSANTAIQTITGFSSLSGVSWTLTGGAGETFSTYVAQWDVTNNAVVGSLTQFGTAGLAFAGGSGALVFNQSLTGLDPSLTYALLLTTTSAGGPTVVANAGQSSLAADGASQAFFGSSTAGYAATSFLSGLGTFSTDLQNPGNVSLFAPSGDFAYTMTIQGSLAPAPEPKTAAAAIAALFVAVLIGRRTWQRRRLVPIPVSA